MKVLLYPTIHGLLILNDDNKLIDIAWRDCTIEELATNYLHFLKGDLSSDISKCLNNLISDDSLHIYLEDPQIVQKLNENGKFKATVLNDVKRLHKIQENEIQYWMDGDVHFSAAELPHRTKIFSETVIKSQISETSTQKDHQIKQASDTIVDIDKSINFFVTRLREWYGLHFPELTDKLIPDNERFSEFVARMGDRNQLDVKNLEQQLNFPLARAQIIVEKAKRSMGGALDEEDLSTIRKLAQNIINLYEYRNSLESYIEKTLNEITPNLITLLGSNITAKLISLAGSLEKLAMLPSSTVQVLGAEKALFKALKSHSDTPKYGVIFQWNKIRGEKSYLRGKIARMVAGKISILAKVDYYQGDFVGDKIGAEVDKKIELIRKQFPKPPKRKHRHQKAKKGQKNYKRHRKGKKQYRGPSKYSKSRSHHKPRRR